jgi:hypothetical protein
MARRGGDRMKYKELTYPDRAQDFLVSHLTQGTLILFIGAGASTGLGLPNWPDLINRLRNGVGLSTIATFQSAEDLQKAADQVLRKCSSEGAYRQLVKKCLYQDIDSLSSDVLQNRLLTALGAMLMGSKRGNVRRVVTLNFDSMLEWYLSLYGFVVRVVFRLPELEGSEDVRIYHPHGFLPHPSRPLWRDSDFLQLSFDSVNERVGTLGDPWFEMTRHLLRSGVCLFVGLSEQTFSDRSLTPLLKTTGQELSSQRPTGIWLLKRDAVPEETQELFLGNNVVPVALPSDKHIVDFLLGICQKAAIDIAV